MQHQKTNYCFFVVGFLFESTSEKKEENHHAREKQRMKSIFGHAIATARERYMCVWRVHFSVCEDALTTQWCCHPAGVGECDSTLGSKSLTSSWTNNEWMLIRRSPRLAPLLALYSAIGCGQPSRMTHRRRGDGVGPSRHLCLLPRCLQRPGTAAHEARSPGEAGDGVVVEQGRGC